MTIFLPGANVSGEWGYYFRPGRVALERDVRAVVPGRLQAAAGDVTRPGTATGIAVPGLAALLPPGAASRLLDGDGGAGALEGCPRLVRALLVDLLQHRLGRAVDQVLGLLQAQARQAAHLLDDLDLLVARGLEDDVELVLLLGRLGLGRAAGRAARRGYRHRGGRLDVERR